MTARITLPLDAYLDAGREDHHACLNCGCVRPPRPRSVSEDASNSIERTCSCCNRPCALPVDQAVKENWLAVTLDGRSVNDIEARS